MKFDIRKFTFECLKENPEKRFTTREISELILKKFPEGFGREFWEGLINFDALVAAGTVAPESLDLFQYVETAEDALAILAEWDANPNKMNKNPPIDKADKAGKVGR